MSLQNSTKIGLIFTIAILFLSVFLYANSASAYMFSRHLSLGDKGADVYELQRALNQNQETRVSLYGPGSVGNETYYFGPKTHSAVIRFQEKYATEVLHPLNLYSGTGYVGALTVKKLNELQGNRATKSPVSEPEETSPQPLSTKPKIYSITPKTGPIETKVTLKGVGFDEKDNTIYASFDKLEGVPSPDGETIEFEIGSPVPFDLLEKIPKERTELIPDFQYEIFVENDNGRSNSVDFIMEVNF